MDPSAGIEAPAVIAKLKAEQASRDAAVSAAESTLPDTTPISAAALVKLTSMAYHLASVWGDESPSRIEVVYVGNSRALDAAMGSLGTPTPAGYAIEMQGSFSCRSCGPGLGLVKRSVLLESFDTSFQRRGGFGGDSWLDLARFGIATTLRPPSTSAVPRPVGPTLPPESGHLPMTLAYARQLALQGAVDPTTCPRPVG